MAALFALAVATPYVREVFELHPGGLTDVLVAAGIAIAACAGIGAAVKVTGTLRT
jgi:cation-transporting ATPase E